MIYNFFIIEMKLKMMDKFSEIVDLLPVFGLSEGMIVINGEAFCMASLFYCLSKKAELLFNYIILITTTEINNALSFKSEIVSELSHSSGQSVE